MLCFVSMFVGMGLGYSVLNSLVCIYYNVIIALALYYLFGSLRASLPWASCDNDWNTPTCGDPVSANTSGQWLVPFIHTGLVLRDNLRKKLSKMTTVTHYSYRHYGLRIQFILLKIRKPLYMFAEV